MFIGSQLSPYRDARPMADKFLTGHFLVASRYLRDPNFVQSVVLMIHHDHEGAMGVVINRPSDKTVREVWEMIGNDPCDRDDLHLHWRAGAGAAGGAALVRSVCQHEVLPGLYVSTHRDALDLIVRKKDCRCGCAAAMRDGAAGSWKARWKPADGCSRRRRRRCVCRPRNDLEDGDPADRPGDHGAGSRPRARAVGSVAELTRELSSTSRERLAYSTCASHDRLRTVTSSHGRARFFESIKICAPILSAKALHRRRISLERAVAFCRTQRVYTYGCSP